MPKNELTPREVEVLRMSAKGLTSAQAATRLKLRPVTVDTCKAAIRVKLGADNTINAVALAYEAGILP